MTALMTVAVVMVVVVVGAAAQVACAWYKHLTR
jgi:hypothetical protein